MSDAPTPKPERPKRSLWKRLLLWSGALTLVGVTMLAIGLWWAWNHQTTVAQWVLNRVPLPVKVELSELNLDLQRVQVRDLVVKDLKSGGEMVRLPTATWKADWRKLTAGDLGALMVNDAQVSLKLADLRGSGGTNTSTSSRPVRFDSIKLANTTVKLEGSEDVPSISAVIDQEITNLNLSDLSKPSVEHFTTTVRNLKTTDGELHAPRMEVEGSLSGSDGILRMSKVDLSTISLKADAKLITTVQEWLTQPAPASQSPSVIKGIEVPTAHLGKTPVRLPGITATLEADGHALKWSAATGTLDGQHALYVTNARVEPPSGNGHIQATALEVKANGLNIEHLKLSGASVDWTADLENWLITPSNNSASTESSALTIQINAAEIDDAVISIHRTTRIPAEGKVTVSAKLKDLQYGREGLISNSPQTLTLRDGVFAEHPQDKLQPLEALAKLTKAELEVVPNHWLKEKRIEKVLLDLPFLKLTPENTTFLKPSKPTAIAEAPKTTPTDEVKVGEFRLAAPNVEFAYDMAQRMHIRGGVEATSVNGAETIKLTKLSVRAPEFTEVPVASVDEISAAFSLKELITNKRVNQLTVKGSEIDVNDVLRRLTMPPASTDTAAPKTASAADSMKGWRIDDLELKGNSITLHKLVPGLPSVKFSLDYTGKDMPLAPTELIGRLEPQKIELSQLYLASPFDAYRDVAIMNTVFIHFTLDGLLKGRIDKVEVISPTLMVGEDLFWYIDYYRKYAAGELPDDTPPPRIVSNDDNFVKETAVAQQDQIHGPPGDASWTLDTLAVTGGNLVIAPKGVPLAGIPRPFPFSFETKLNQGKFEAELKIPGDNYTWEDIKLEFQNLRGHVLFNLPHKQMDNNLTETFQVDVIRYKQLHMEKCHLSVTYDAAGIYGQFGGAAYEGYVNGAFNIYNDSTFSWDGWITGTGVKTTEITEKLTPTYLFLDGKMDASVVALGNMSEVFQTDLSLTGTSPGKFSITTLNDAIKAIPLDIEGYIQDLTRIGIETVRDFDYDKAEAKARFYGREGRGYLRLRGPHGTRNIDVNVYDHRWKVDKKKASNAEASE
ncbi:MAG: hypothetical protein JNJ83_08065 [Verrucomicrobiaceae bacterium]|nr:hypothetical protein [Verrucomicrobiaceae bacterium]